VNITKLLRNKITFIIGSKKNAGKTTFLNYGISSLRKTENIAYLTIGVDGEKTDQIFGTPKPKIFAHKGDMLLSTDSSIKQSDASFNILNTYPSPTVLGRLMLLEVLRDGYVELIGPQNNSQLADILRDIRKHKIKTILVDGAINRITQLSSQDNSYFIYVAQLRPENLNSTIDSIKLIYQLWQTPLYKPEICKKDKDAALVYLNGAITKKKINFIKKGIKTIVFEDFTKVFLSYRDWQNLSKKHRLYFKEKFELSSFIVNLYNISKEDFENSLNSPEIMKKIIFSPYAK